MSSLLDSLINSVYLWLTLTVGFYVLATQIYKRLPIPLFNPLLFSIVMIIIILLVTEIPYATYEAGGKVVSIFVTPATVSLAIKLEKNIIYLKKNVKAILIGIFSGVVLHTVMIGLFGILFKFDLAMAGTLFPKSITTAIAIGVSESLGGHVSLTVAVVVFTGIIGAVIGPSIMRWTGITNPVAQGIAMGSSAHAMGTSKAIEMGPVQGAMSGLSIVVTGITIVILAPFVQPLIQLLFG